MLHKVLQKLAKEKLAEVGKPKPGYVPPKPGQQKGFHSKGNSTSGAERARSIGNRLIKPSNSK